MMSNALRFLKDLEQSREYDGNLEHSLKVSIAELEVFEKEYKKSQELVDHTLDLGKMIIKQIEALEKKQIDVDRIATLEAIIRDYYVAKGHAVGSGNWGFQVSINSIYKWKILKVYFYENDIENAKIVFSAGELDTKKMFDKAFIFFTCKDNA